MELSVRRPSAPGHKNVESGKSTLWAAIRRFSRPGSDVFVMDLLRPESTTQAEALVDRHAAGEPDVLRRDFRRSLHAAYRPAEVYEQLRRAGLAHLGIEVVSDRHLIVHGTIDAATASTHASARSLSFIQSNS